MKNKIIVLTILLLVVIMGVIVIISGIEKEDVFLGIWKTKGVGVQQKIEIYKIGKNYNCQYISTATGEKMALYKDGYITNGYLVFDNEDRYYGLEIKNNDELLSYTFLKPDYKSKIEDCKKEVNGSFIREE